MATFQIDINKAKEPKKTSKDFTEEEKKALFTFLEANDEDENALKFAMDWFKCTQMTIVLLTMNHIKENNIGLEK